ncbi:competence-related pilin export protein ComGB [Streptohalobacillus salinus]|uniref:Competence-related pilin export protein ComGB n=1 Tax=Streptohalobacillus salinus TaxID=621096 RepID=A0A2V3WSG1_9BACI|nr:type II secretion system F family protein [Streptohalobacillus salinus]PXW91659.1 competence-related pilin export protein ComGB [Streptohalobacillus salinus]
MVTLTPFHNKTKQLNLDQQLHFIEVLGQLLQQHYSINQALIIIQWQKQYQPLAQSLSLALTNGIRFDVALNQTGFHHQIVSFVHFALIHGNLTEAFVESTALIKQQLRIQQSFKKTMRYPLILIMSFLLMLFFTQHYVYPNFQQLYQTNQVESSLLTLSTQAVDIVFNLLVISAYLLIAGTIFILLSKRLLKTAKQLAMLSRIPIVFPLLRYYFSFMLATHIGALLESKLSIKECFVALTEKQSTNYFAFITNRLEQALSNGSSLDFAVLNETFLTEDLYQIFKKQEPHPQLKRDLTAYTRLLLDQLTQAVDRKLTMIQPIVFVTIAVSIVLVYLSILLPMLDMIQIV